MLHYINTDIVFQEFPDEVTLAINVSGCPCHCPGCHSQFLWADRGHDLTTEALSALIREAKDTITCVGFMGGDGDPAEVDRLAEHVRQNHAGLKVGWYTGRTAISPLIDQQRSIISKWDPISAISVASTPHAPISGCTADALMDPSRISPPASGNIRLGTNL